MVDLLMDLIQVYTNKLLFITKFYVGNSFSVLVPFFKEIFKDSWFKIPIEPITFSSNWRHQNINPVGLEFKFQISKRIRNAKTLPKNIKNTIPELDLDTLLKKKNFFKRLVHKSQEWQVGEVGTNLHQLISLICLVKIEDTYYWIENFLVYEYNSKGYAAALLNILKKRKKLNRFLYYITVEKTNDFILISSTKLTKKHSTREACSLNCMITNDYQIQHQHNDVLQVYFVDT
jgi:hypothetical protein